MLKRVEMLTCVEADYCCLSLIQFCTCPPLCVEGAVADTSLGLE